MVVFVTDAHSSSRAVPMPAAEARARLANVDVVHTPAMPLAGALLLDPTELRGTVRGRTRKQLIWIASWEKDTENK